MEVNTQQANTWQDSPENEPEASNSSADEPDASGPPPNLPRVVKVTGTFIPPFEETPSTTQYRSWLETNKIKTIKKYSCNLCESNFDNLRFLRCHQFSHAEKVFVKCSKCPWPLYNDLQRLKRHIRDSHSLQQSQKLFECFTCDRKFEKAIQMAEHFWEDYCEGGQTTVATTAEPSTKNKIWRPFVDDEDDDHQNVDSSQSEVAQDVASAPVPPSGKKYQKKCNKCDYYSRKEYGVKRHMLMHVPKAFFRCPYCLKSFGHDVRNLATHMHKVHSNVGAPVYRCPQGHEIENFTIKKIRDHIWDYHFHGLHVIDCANKDKY